MTSNDAQVVKDVVNEFVTKGWSFTAYTITTEARKRGAKGSHDNMKRIVHDMFNDGEMQGYTRDTKDVGANIQPFFYAPDSNAPGSASTISPTVAVADPASATSNANPVVAAVGDGSGAQDLSDWNA